MLVNQVGYFSKKMKKTRALILIIEFVLLNISFLFSQEDLLRIEMEDALDKNYTLKKSGINSSTNTSGAFSYKDTLYFSSNRRRRRIIQHVNEDYSDFYNIYFSSVDTTNQKNNNISLLSGAVNTIFNESFPFITKSGKTIYYTANLTEDGEVLKNLYILRATKENGIWGNVENVSINDKGFSNGQAVLNDAENIMYFVSDRDSDTGDTDIYVVTIHPDGSFGTPNKLDKNVNTAKQEISPFVTKNNELYFSSKGYGGFGGFDIFYIDLNEPDAKPINLGSAINSTEDDFSFSMMRERPSKGFLSSNKEGYLNIYQVSEHYPIKKILEEERKKYDAAKLVEKYQVTVVGNKIITPIKIGFQPSTQKLNTEGKEFLQYLINYIRENPTAVLDVNAVINSNEVSADLLNKRISHVVDKIRESTKYTYQFKIVAKRIPPIAEKEKKNKTNVAFYFDYNSSYLNEISKEKLDAIASKLKADRTLRIDLATHADSRGTNAYNRVITKRRLERVKSYLYSKNVRKFQISGKAFGETKIVNKCIEGVTCNASDHKKNRRVNYNFFRDTINNSVKIKN
jgi:outer membrane protein OmpA-like peptidoglycan-associated protein